MSCYFEEHGKNIINTCDVSMEDTYETIKNKLNESKLGYEYGDLREIVAYLKSLLTISNEDFITSVTARVTTFKDTLISRQHPIYEWTLLTMWRKVD